MCCVPSSVHPAGSVAGVHDWQGRPGPLDQLVVPVPGAGQEEHAGGQVASRQAGETW